MKKSSKTQQQALCQRRKVNTRAGVKKINNGLENHATKVQYYRNANMRAGNFESLEKDYI